MELTNKAIRKAFEGAKTRQEVLDRLQSMAQDYAEEILHKNPDIRLIILHGSIGRELSREKPVGTVVWEGSDMDIACYDSSTDFEELKAEWRSDTPHWLSGSVALYDPGNLLPQLKAECSKWSVENRKKIIGQLWMKNLGIKRCALAFLEQDNVPAALWAARKAFELVLDIGMLFDDFVPCTPKYDWHCLRRELKETLIKLHTVDSSDREAVENVIEEADNRHWELKEAVEEFLELDIAFHARYNYVRFPILRWL